MVSRFRRRLVLVLLICYAAFVCVVTLSPRMPGSSTIAIWVSRLLAELHERGIAMWADFLVVEFFGNILMFVPLGILTALAIERRHWWMLLFLGTAFSGTIELAQHFLLPARFAEWRDVASNTIGFLAGATVAVLFRLLVAHRDRLVVAEARSRQPLAD